MERVHESMERMHAREESCRRWRVRSDDWRLTSEGEGYRTAPSLRCSTGSACSPLQLIETRVVRVSLAF